MSSTARPIVALCGPSGVGKEYVKDIIRSDMPYTPFSEPIVATTRQRRADERSSRDAGLAAEDFQARCASGAIVLAHKPYRTDETDWYGFVANSFVDGHYQLTEIHSTILVPFQERIQGRPSLVVGLVASRETLEVNLVNRQQEDRVSRLEWAEREVDEIQAGLANGTVDAVFDLSLGVRAAQQASIKEIVGAFYGA